MSGAASGRANAKYGRAHLWWDRLSLNSVASRTWHCAIMTHCELIGSIEQHLNPYNSPVLATHMGPALPRLAMGQMRLAGSKLGIPSKPVPCGNSTCSPTPLRYDSRCGVIAEDDLEGLSEPGAATWRARPPLTYPQKSSSATPLPRASEGPSFGEYTTSCMVPRRARFYTLLRGQPPVVVCHPSAPCGVLAFLTSASEASIRPGISKPGRGNDSIKSSVSHAG